MSWNWYATYIQAISQSDLRLAIQDTIERVTQNQVRLVDENYYPKRTYGSLYPDLVYFLSPQTKGWTAFWGGGYAISFLVFEAHSLSGLLISGQDELLDVPASSIQGKFWEYVIFEKGKIRDWFVFNPVRAFLACSSALMVKFALPFLRARGRLQMNNDPPKSIDKLLRENYDLFAQPADAVHDFTQPLVGVEKLNQWHQLQTRPALELLPAVLRLPYVGPRYSLYVIGTYHDLLRGRPQPPQDLHYLDLDIPAENRYERDREWQEQVSDFQPVLFASFSLRRFSGIFLDNPDYFE